jgi:hypothetical protein
MRGISSDVIALAAVLGSAAVAGVVTLALATGDSGEVSYECLVTEVETAPRVMVAHNDGHTAIVVAPKLHARSAEVCTEIVVYRLGGDVIRLEQRARFQVERAREGVERSRHEIIERVERVERVRRDRSLGEELAQEFRHELETVRVMVDGIEIEFEGLGELRKLELEGLSEALELQFRGRSQLEADQLEAELERMELEMRGIDDELKEDLKEELKRIIDELRRKRRKGGR